MNNLKYKFYIEWKYINSYLIFEYDDDFWIILWLDKSIQNKTKQVVDVEIKREDFLNFIEYGNNILQIESFKHLEEFSKYTIIYNDILIIPCNCAGWIMEHYFHIFNMEDEGIIIMKIIFNELKGKDSILLNKKSFARLLQI